MSEKVKPLLTIGTVTIYASEKGTYVRFVGDEHFRALSYFR